MKLRPCIDIHNGKVKQIVGNSLKDKGDSASENFVSERGADFYARMYKELGLSGGHIILLNPVDSPFYEGTKKQALEALKIKKLFNQYVFATNRSLKVLKFVKAEEE